MRTKNSEEMRNCEIGCHPIIEPNVILGYHYLNDKNPLIVGDHARFHSGSVIYADSVIGHHFTCGHNVTIRAHCNLGDRVVILHNTTLEGNIRIGKGVKIMAHVYIPSQTIIKDMVFIGPGVTILNARLPMREGDIQGVVIGNNVVVGGGVTINPGVEIGDNSFIASGATVISNIPGDSLAYGTPATYKPLPKKFGRRNDPSQIFTGLDLWNNTLDDGLWKSEDFFGKEDWLNELGST